MKTSNPAASAVRSKGLPPTARTSRPPRPAVATSVRSHDNREVSQETRGRGAVPSYMRSTAASRSRVSCRYSPESPSTLPKPRTPPKPAKGKYAVPSSTRSGNKSASMPKPARAPSPLSSRTPLKALNMGNAVGHEEPKPIVAENPKTGNGDTENEFKPLKFDISKLRTTEKVGPPKKPKYCEFTGQRIEEDAFAAERNDENEVEFGAQFVAREEVVRCESESPIGVPAAIAFEDNVVESVPADTFKEEARFRQAQAAQDPFLNGMFIPEGDDEEEDWFPECQYVPIEEETSGIKLDSSSPPSVESDCLKIDDLFKNDEECCVNEGEIERDSVPFVAVVDKHSAVSSDTFIENDAKCYDNIEATNCFAQLTDDAENLAGLQVVVYSSPPPFTKLSFVVGSCAERSDSTGYTPMEEENANTKTPKVAEKRKKIRTDVKRISPYQKRIAFAVGGLIYSVIGLLLAFVLQGLVSVM